MLEGTDTHNKKLCVILDWSTQSICVLPQQLNVLGAVVTGFSTRQGACWRASLILSLDLFLIEPHICTGAAILR